MATTGADVLIDTIHDWGVDVIFGLPGDGINGIQACRAALSYRGVAHINFPVDFQSMGCEERSERNIPHHTSDVYARSRGLPAEEDLRRAAEVLNAGKKIVILAGRGALGATNELEALAERLAAPIVKPLLGKAVVPDDSPYTTGGIGLPGTRPSQEAMEECDTLFMIGTSFPYIEFLPKPGQARGVQIDIDPLRIGLRYPYEPPMPPKVSMKQALKFAESLARGEPNRGKIALTVLSDKVRELV